MISVANLDRRPIIVAIAGPNGAGKTTFFHSHLASAGIRFVNADVLAAELATDPYAAARQADAIRRGLVRTGESFAFETVFSDPVGDKIAFLEDALRVGYAVVLCFIGLENSDLSVERVALRVLQGGHDVPDEKLHSRFPRTLANLDSAISRLPHVDLFDNSDLSRPFRQVASFEHGIAEIFLAPIPDWVQILLKSRILPQSI